MNLDSVLARGRAKAESLHRDTFTVWRRAGETENEDLEVVPVFEPEHTDIRGKFKGLTTQNRAVETPGQQLAETTPEWHTSISVTGIRTGDEVECTAVDPLTGDPDLVGVRVRITGPFIQSHATARRFRVEELT